MNGIEKYLELFQKSMQENKVIIPREGTLAGGHLETGMNKEWMKLFWYDNMHYPMGNAFLEFGIPGIIEKIEKGNYPNTENAAYMDAVLMVYKKILDYVERHAAKAQALSEAASEKKEQERLSQIAQNCEALTKKAPSNFAEGMQLFWFLYVIRSPFGGGCIGRLDQRLYPYYKQETENGTLEKEKVLELILEFYQKLNLMKTGDTLRNLMLSGQDASGKDETNELTYLFLEAYERTGDAEPHLNVRLHAASPAQLKQKCVHLLGMGKGQPTLYFDENIIPSMEEAGIPHAMASKYANDGCTETVIDGESNIFFLQHEMVKTVELTLFNGKENPSIQPVDMKKSEKDAPKMRPKTGLLLGYQSGDLCQMQSFAEVFHAFERQLEVQLEKWIKVIHAKIEYDEKEQITSPLIGGTFKRCLENGKDPLRGGGFEVSNYQLLSGSIGTAADCLRGIQVAVFEKKWCTMEVLLSALASDFDNSEVLQQRLKNIPKYGNGEKEVDQIAAAIGKLFIQKVNSYKSASGKCIWPGLYNIDFKIFANITGATPDGRKFRDFIGEHCSPTPGGARKGPTAILESASKLPMKEGYASSPLHLSLDKNSFVMGADKENIISQLIDGARRQGIPVLNISMYSKEELLDAKIHPEQHQDLIVRVWGFNARFVELDEELQEHIIKRIS